MPIFDCTDPGTLNEVLQDAVACLVHGGFRLAFWSTYDQVDWENTTWGAIGTKEGITA